MPRPTPMPIRQAMWAAAQAGEAVASLAARLDTPQRTVRRLLRSFRSSERPAAPAYRAGPRDPRWPAEMVDHALCLRQLHPGWGAGMLQVQLARKFPGAALPQPRTIQRWLAGAGLAPAPAGRRREPRLRATSVHEVWEIDACDQLALATGQLVSWLRLTDEHSGAVLQTVVFPPGLEQGRHEPHARRAA
jgi:hypothetical protein